MTTPRDAWLYLPQRCMNPACGNLCELPLDGRPAAFCSSTCRTVFARRRTELLQARDRIDDLIASAAKRDRPALRRQRKAIRFSLMRHPAIPTSADS